MFNIIILGAPGCGKGTQSANIIGKYGFTHISSGEILREEIELHTTIGEVVKKFIDKGFLVPDDIMMKEILITTLIEKQPKGLLFDGFPRTLFQANYLDDLLQKKESKISLVIHMDVDEDDLYKRILNRSIDSQRSDDKLETIKKRLEVYYEQTYPLIDYYKKQSKLQTVRAMAPVKEVFGVMSTIIDEYLINESK
ncbi:MAG: adenylate kinase [Bacteroidales bacterium]